jgi:hypothetical protein
MHRLSRVSIPVFTLIALTWVAPIRGQEQRPACPPAETHRYDFLVGAWHGTEYVFKNGAADSAFEASWTARNVKLPYACAYEEHNEIIENGRSFNRVAMLRAFDLGSNQWMYSLVDEFVELSTFSSTRSDSGWVFSHDLTGAKPIRLHTLWVATPSGYTEVMRVSTDSGRTWPIVRHVNYTRDPER